MPKKKAPTFEERFESACMALKLAGLIPAYRGYFYLAECIATVSEKYNNSEWEIKLFDVYEQVAIKHQTTPGNIERNIRTAIQSAYLNPNVTAWRLISTIADLITPIAA